MPESSYSKVLDPPRATHLLTDLMLPPPTDPDPQLFTCLCNMVTLPCFPELFLLQCSAPTTHSPTTTHGLPEL